MSDAVFTREFPAAFDSFCQLSLGYAQHTACYLASSQEDTDALQDDDEYYATHASGFITSPSLPSPPLLLTHAISISGHSASPADHHFGVLLRSSSPACGRTLPKAPVPVDALSTPWRGIRACRRSAEPEPER